MCFHSNSFCLDELLLFSFILIIFDVNWPLWKSFTKCLLVDSTSLKKQKDSEISKLTHCRHIIITIIHIMDKIQTNYGQNVAEDCKFWVLWDILTEQKAWNPDVVYYFHFQSCPCRPSQVVKGILKRNFQVPQQGSENFL